jgi:hypothetical protein
MGPQATSLVRPATTRPFQRMNIGAEYIWHLQRTGKNCPWGRDVAEKTEQMNGYTHDAEPWKHQVDNVVQSLQHQDNLPW